MLLIRHKFEIDANRLSFGLVYGRSEYVAFEFFHLAFYLTEMIQLPFADYMPCRFLDLHEICMLIFTFIPSAVIPGASGRINKNLGNRNAFSIMPIHG